MAQKGCHHMTQAQRCSIEALLSIGMSRRGIAEKTGVNASTISREIARNSVSGVYKSGSAQEISSRRRSAACSAPKKLKGGTKTLVLERLKKDWSPEQISGRLKLQGIFISHETIYKYVRSDRNCGGSLYKHLRHGGKKYRARSSKQAGVGCIPNRVDISERPAIVDEKLRIGDWEGDTVISHRSRCALMTLVDRHSKFLITKKIGRKTMDNINSSITKRLKNLGKPVQTITFDNGKEFAGHAKITKKTGAKIYFARPYRSCDRGLNEHTNGLIRQYLPKKQDFQNVSHKKIREIENKLNNRPRKVLGYKTPFEVFFANELVATYVCALWCISFLKMRETEYFLAKSFCKIMNILFAVIVLMEILAGIEIDICVPSFPEIQRVFKVSTFGVEGLLGINLFTICVGSLIAGNLGDRYGRKPVILSGLLLFIIGSLMCVFAINYPMLFTGRLIQGVGMSSSAYLAYVIIPDTYDIKTHQKLLGLLNFFATAAMAVAPVVGSHITLYCGWRGNFSFCLVFGILLFILGYFFLPPGEKNDKVSLSLFEYLNVLKNKKAMTYIFTICFFVVGYWVFIGMAPILYLNDLGVKLEHFGFYQGTMATVFAIVSLLSERLFTWFGTRKCFFVSIVVIIASLVFMTTLVLLNSRNPLLITGTMALMSAGLICPVNALWPYVFNAAPNEKGKVNAMFTFVKMVSISLLVQSVSYFYSGSFQIIGSVVVLTLIVALLGSRKLLKIDPIFDEKE
jgi:DHA1 family bicyclomycin/chloramphenicol resistance-like MFS transporter